MLPPFNKEPISVHRPFQRIGRFIVRLIGGLIVTVLLGMLGAYLLIQPPAQFPVPYRITIERGQTLFSISEELTQAQVIRSPRVFELLMLSLGDEKQISEGEYVFDRPLSVIEVAMRISGRHFGVGREKVTFPEGFSVKEMADRLAMQYVDFDKNTFFEKAIHQQGYLFPDTYRFFPSVSPDVVIATLTANYERKIAPLRTTIEQSGYTEKEIIIMASLIEKEASGAEDRAVIAGILWKRIKKGMPLQVDAPFLYLLGKESKELTRADLALISPYNTYVNKGLPPAPINNPGIEAIRAALYPTESPYLFYLHDAKGAVHYARTFADHKKNIKKFL